MLYGFHELKSNYHFILKAYNNLKPHNNQDKDFIYHIYMFSLHFIKLSTT